jgi:DNA-binding response OmpR family regulator
VDGLKRILYVDADREARLLMQDVLAPHQLDIVATDDEARALVRSRSYDLYLIAGSGPDSPAIALCAWLQRTDGRTPIVFCSSNGSDRYQQAAIEAGAVRYLVKPLDPTVLRSTLSLLLKLAELESARAMAIEQQAIHDELVLQSRKAQSAAAAAREKAQAALDAMLRAKAYRAFRAAGGNRANFERLWPDTLQRANCSKV